MKQSIKSKRKKIIKLNKTLCIQFSAKIISVIYKAMIFKKVNHTGI